MSETRFTPGPWEARGLSIWQPGKTALSIASVTQHQPAAKANAHLISAAPDLYDSLAQLLDDPDNETENRAFARRMLAKARGEQS